MGENICKWRDGQGIIFQKIQTAQTAQYQKKQTNKKKNWKMGRDFPGGPVVKNPPSNAGDADSIPAQGIKIPHAVGQLSLHATTTEPAL